MALFDGATLMKSQADAVKAKLKKHPHLEDVSIDDFSEWFGGPELKSIGLEYIFGTNVLLLGRIYELFGKEGCYKSTVMSWLLGRYFMPAKAPCYYIETENKFNPELCRDMLYPYADDLRMYKPRSVEAVQDILSGHYAWLDANLIPGAPPPIVIQAVDSIRVSTEEGHNQIGKQGHTQRQIAPETLLWTSYMGAISGMMRDKPVILFYTNHEKEKQVQTGGGTAAVAGRSGASALRFGQTVSIRIQAEVVGTSTTQPKALLHMRTYKNSNAENRRDFDLMLYHRNTTDDSSRAYIDLPYSDALFLATSADIPTDLIRKAGICSMKEASTKGRFTDDINGKQNVPPEEALEPLYSDPDKMRELRKLLGIHCFKNMDQLLADGWFLHKEEEKEKKAKTPKKA